MPDDERLQTLNQSRFVQWTTKHERSRLIESTVGLVAELRTKEDLALRLGGGNMPRARLIGACGRGYGSNRYWRSQRHWSLMMGRHTERLPGLHLAQALAESLAD